ncbi:MAG: PfkB family carbohydrate kinase [Acidobacteriota bacterium]
MTDGLVPLIDQFPRLKILLLGDFILDEFIFGEISRVSREAPVLILKYRHTETAPGGGANTVTNVDRLGAEAIPVGFLGRDQAAGELLSGWSNRVNRDYIFQDADFQTTRKSRLLAGSFHSSQQQLVRLDYEHPYHLKAAHEQKILNTLSELVPEVDAILLSDYSLGCINPAIREAALSLAAKHEKILVADSRDHPHDYAGATSITPNITEVEAALSLSIGDDLALLEEVGTRLLQEWRLDALLVTRGKLGMSLFLEKEVIHVPIFGSDEIADVTGAGDTVTATYSLALAAGGTFPQAAQLANRAAGLVVMKKGTATVSPRELRDAVQGDL